MPTHYVSTACRGEHHEDCRDHPVVLCACVCHDGERREPPPFRLLASDPEDQ